MYFCCGLSHSDSFAASNCAVYLHSRFGHNITDIDAHFFLVVGNEQALNTVFLPELSARPLFGSLKLKINCKCASFIRSAFYGNGSSH